MPSSSPVRVHFIGIGGSGMAPLARLAALAAEPAYEISGSDPGLTPERLAALRADGWRVFAEHDPSHLDDCDIVVFSSAIAPEHPERAAARERARAGELVLEHRMDFLMRLVARCPVQLSVAGTHGKTSTASLLGWILLRLGVDPDIIVGGRPAYLPAGVRRGAGQVAVYETDESDASFLKTTAGFRLCLNVDRDHLEHYGGMDGLIEAFVEFASRGDAVIFNRDDAVLRDIVYPAAGAGRKLWYTTSGDAPDATAASTAGYFVDESDVLRLVAPALKEPGATIRMPLPGRHFASNALGAFALVDAVRAAGRVPALNACKREDIVAAINEFPGVERRLELLGRPGGVAVYDDYGHHPTEIRAVLAALRGRLDPGARLVAVFQPHRYSRTAALYDQFAAALGVDADLVYLLPIYGAGEAPRAGVSETLIRDARAARGGSPEFLLLERDAWARVFAECAPGDVVACLGAGDISSSIRSFLKS